MRKMNQTPTKDISCSTYYASIKNGFEIDELISVYLENRWIKKLRFFAEKSCFQEGQS